MLVNGCVVPMVLTAPLRALVVLVATLAATSLSGAQAPKPSPSADNEYPRRPAGASLVRRLGDV